MNTTTTHTTTNAMIAANIRRLREERHWSQAHLAGAAGVAERTVQRAEETGNVHGETVLAIAAALGVDHAVLEIDAEKVMRAVEALEKAQREERERLAATHTLVNLVRIDSSARCAEIAGAQAWIFDTELEDDPTQDAIAQLRSWVTDVNTVWRDIDAVQQREYAKEILGRVHGIEALGRIVKVGFVDRRFGDPGGGEPVMLHVALVVIADKDDDRPVAGLPRRGFARLDI